MRRRAEKLSRNNFQVELAIFVDEMLWRHFSSKYGSSASTKLQDYALTMLNNIQIMYHQPSAVPQLTFHVVRFEVLTKQPVRFFYFASFFTSFFFSFVFLTDYKDRLNRLCRFPGPVIRTVRRALCFKRQLRNIFYAAQLTYLETF